MKKIMLFILLLFPIFVKAEDLTPNAESGILIEYSTGKILYSKKIDEKLEIPEEFTGKMTHSYIDEKYTCNLRDYTGKVAEVSQQRYIHLEKQPFKMSIEEEFEFLKEVDSISL